MCDFYGSASGNAGADDIRPYERTGNVSIEFVGAHCVRPYFFMQNAELGAVSASANLNR